MRKQGIFYLSVPIFLLLISVFIFPDTIVLKNGKKIHTSWVKVEGDLVTYKLTAGLMTIRKDLIKEIIKDDTAELKKEKETTETSADESSSSETSSSGTETESSSTSTKEKDPKESGAYWNSERKRLLEEKTTLEAELKDLENYRVALIRARRSTADIAKRIEEKRSRLKDILTDLSAIIDKAKQFGVTEWDIDHAGETQKEEGGGESSEEGGGG